MIKFWQAVGGGGFEFIVRNEGNRSKRLTWMRFDGIKHDHAESDLVNL